MVILLELLNKTKTVRGAIRSLKGRQINPKENIVNWAPILVKATRVMIDGGAKYENADKTLAKGKLIGSKIPEWRLIKFYFSSVFGA